MELSKRRLCAVAQAAGGSTTVTIVAGIAAVAVADSSQGSVVYTPASQAVNVLSESAPVDFDQDGATDFEIEYFNTTPPYMKVQIDLNNALTNEQFRADTNGQPLALAAGTSIGSATDYIPGSGFGAGILNDPGSTPPSGNFPTSAGEKFIGLEFTEPDSSLHYGYIAYESTSDDPASPAGELLGYAFESATNTPIAAGAVPEPSSLGLLAMGVVGLARYRKKRKA